MSFMKMAGLGAMSVPLGLLAAYGLLLYVSVPTSTGGMDRVLFAVIAVSCAVVIALLGAVHVALGKQLLDGASGD